MATAPDILVRRGLDRGLVGTILASAAIHAAVVAVLITMPGRLLGPSSKIESYTVDLVAPDVVGGTNLIPGGGKAKAPVSKPGPPVPAEPKPEPVVVQPPVAEPAKQLPPAAPAEAAEPPPPKAAAAAPPAEPPKAVEPPEPAQLPKAAAEAPKPAQPAQPAVKLSDAKPVAPPKPAPVADAKPPEPKPVPNAAEPPKAVAKAAAPAKPAPVAAAKEPPKKPGEATKAAAAPNPVDDEIAAAVQRRAAQVQSGSGGGSREMDKQIAAAVQRRADQVGAGAGSGASGPGGLVSIGPGSGAGGTAAGIDYILYQGKMEQKIKAAWAWAGADRSRRAVIQFNLTADGEIKNVRTIESSGDAQYDASCERAVRAVNPLEPVPERYRKEFATVELTFKPDDLEH